jgi:peptide/nickel transport system ATP-binding protein
MALASAPPTNEPLPGRDRSAPSLSSLPLESGATPTDNTAGGARVVLDVRDLKTYFYTYDGVVKALDGVSFKIRQGETLGLVGETGCGKSVTAFSITRLIPDPPGRIMSGKVLFRGANLLWGLEKEARYKPVPRSNRVKVTRSFRRIKANSERMSAVRGRGISMIFQEPTQAMNPIFSISDQISEALLLHRGSEIFNGLLNATPDDPAVQVALQNLIDVARQGVIANTREAAAAVGRAANLPSLGTQAFYIVRAAGPAVADCLPDLQRALERVRLSRLQRSYIRQQVRLTELKSEQDDVFMSEMRAGHVERGPRRSIRRRRNATRLRGFYLGLWGIRGRARRPVKQETLWATVGLLEGVQIANPVQVARGYPHELSGGMLQRVMIAMALSAEPDILIADEPTTALDVTIQAQILELMRELKERVGTAIVLITHDLAVVAEVADRVCVMYAGQIVESAPVRDLFRHPLHPYAQGLLASIPRMDQPDRKLESIPGSVPNLITPPSGCRFHPRCPYAMPICKEERPPLTLEGERHTVACYLYKGPVAVE